MREGGEFTMSFFGGLDLVILLWLSGKGLLPPTQTTPRSMWESACLSFLLGAGFWVIGATAMLAIGITFAWIPWTLTAMALGLAWRSWKRGDFKAERHCPTGLGKGSKILLVALGCLSVVSTLSLPINEFDSLLHFAYKGKVLLGEGHPHVEAMTGMMAADGSPLTFGRLVTHPNYPLGIPILEASTGFLTGWHERWVQWPLALWALCIPGVVFFGLRRVSLQAAGIGALVAACTPILYARHILAEGWQSLSAAGLGNTMTLGAGADLPVAALFAAACACLLRARWERSMKLNLLAGLALAAAAMMKNEGLALVGVFFLAALLAGILCPFRNKSKERFRSLALLGVVLMALTPWLILRGQLPAIDENYSQHLNIERVSHFVSGGAELVEKSPKVIAGQVSADNLLATLPSRPKQIGNAFWGEFSDWRSWGVLWILVLVSFPWRIGFKDRERTWLSLMVLGGISLYALILLVTPWYLPLLLDKGIPDRLLLHLIGPMALLVGWSAGTNRTE